MESDARLRIVFFGTPEFAVPSLERLIASRHAVVAAVTQPDRPSGRGQRLDEPPVKKLSATHRIPVFQPERLKDVSFLARLSDFNPELGVVAAYGRIIPDAVIEIPRLGLINVHASLLPRYRGAAPIQRAVMAGERETGVTIMRIVRELDAGPVFAAAARPIGPDETGDDVERGLALIGADLLIDTVDALASGRAREVPQDSSHATYATRLSKTDGLIDWRQPAQTIHDLVRALHRWPRAFTDLDGIRYVLLRTAVSTERPTPSVPPGSVLRASAGTILVAAGNDTAIEILELQPPNRRPMTAREFLAGHHLTRMSTFGAKPDQ